MRAGLFGLLLACAAVCAGQQGGYRIAGTVTNSVTGEAVAGATMTISGETSHDQVQTAQTDNEGHFTMGPVPAGKYSLQAARRGYLSEAFNEHDSYSSAIVTGEGQDTEHIPFHLDPGALIRGTVTDDAGEPVENARVIAARRMNSLGLGEHMQMVRTVQTDDTGAFEVWGLQPGTYFLAASGAPWFAMHPPKNTPQSQLSDEDRAAMAALDVAYPVTYYDGATQEDAAAPIALKSGDRVDVSLALHAVPALHITVPSNGANPGMTAIRQTVFGGDQFSGMPMSTSKDGGIEISGVAPGHYTVMQGNPPREVPVDATANQELDLSAAQSLYTVEIKASMVDGSQVPRLWINLVSEDSTQRLHGQADANGTVKIEGVPPGVWNVQAGALSAEVSGQLGVVAIQSGTAAARGTSRIVVKDRALSLKMTLAAGHANVEGFAAKGGKNEAGVMIVLVPKYPDEHLMEFRRDQSDSDGSFSVKSAVPGSYTVVAIEDGWDLDWAKPEVIGRYLANGVAVTVPANAGAVVKLNAPVPVQQK